jgi:catechol 2,3-dioxygenase-like lactoylglutathione lyase family enzyme
MVTLAEVTERRIGRAAASVVKPVALSRGTLASRDLDLTRRFLEDVLGMECARSGDRLLARHRADRGKDAYWVLEVVARPHIEHPQKMLNHWGFEAASPEEVERIHDRLAASPETWGLKRIHPVKANHGSYSFYCEDVDSNWWEIESRAEEISYAASVALGDPEGDRA